KVRVRRSDCDRDVVAAGRNSVAADDDAIGARLHERGGQRGVARASVSLSPNGPGRIQEREASRHGLSTRGRAGRDLDRLSGRRDERERVGVVRGTDLPADERGLAGTIDTRRGRAVAEVAVAEGERPADIEEACPVEVGEEVAGAAAG